MVLAPSVAGLFKWRQFEPEVILLVKKIPIIYSDLGLAYKVATHPVLR